MQSLRPLLHEHRFPVLVPDRQDVAVIADVEEELARAFLDFTGQIGEHVVAVKVHLEGLVAGLMALEQFLLDVGFSRGGQESRQPVLMA